MNLSDSDLLMLVNLTYINQDTSHFVEGLRDLSQYVTLHEYLAAFDEKALQKLELMGDAYVAGGKCSGSELAAMIRYMKGRDAIKTLRITGAAVYRNNSPFAFCFRGPYDPLHGIVVFHGTIDAYEWKDNALGLYLADTPAQLESLQYIEALPYRDLTVAGHSKGGNKAQYVGIRSKKVVRSVSFDGQGFSREFLDKYATLISQNAAKVKNYSLSTDFVHPLLFALPGATEIYVDGGSDVKNILEHHSPNAFFVYYEDSDNLTQIVCTKDGAAYFPLTKEDPSVKVIHNFTSYIQNNTTKKERKLLGDFVGDLLYISTLPRKGKGERQLLLLQRLTRNPAEIVTLLSYLLQYIETYHLTLMEDVILLQVLRLTGLPRLAGLPDFDLQSLYKALRSELAAWEKWL